VIRAHTLHVPGADAERDAIVAKQMADPDLDVVLHADPQRKGVMQNWLGALKAALDDDQEWALILQDDADPLPGWAEHFALATANSPSPLLGLTHFGGYGSEVIRKGGAYGIGRVLIWGGASCIHRDHLLPLLRAALQFHQKTGYAHDDGAMALYGQWIGTGTAMTARALFDQPVQASLLGHNTKVRRPTATIANCDGPPYADSPVIPVSRGDRAKFEQRYARFINAQGGHD
jgi:hypothetical protein